MIISVNGRDYRVRLRAAAWPHLRLLSNAFTDEAVDEEKLKIAEEKVLKLCVEGDVHPDDADELVLKILAQFARIVGSEFGTFRPTLSAAGR